MNDNRTFPSWASHAEERRHEGNRGWVVVVLTQLKDEFTNEQQMLVYGHGQHTVLQFLVPQESHLLQQLSNLPSHLSDVTSVFP